MSIMFVNYLHIIFIGTFFATNSIFAETNQQQQKMPFFLHLAIDFVAFGIANVD